MLSAFGSGPPSLSHALLNQRLGLLHSPLALIFRPYKKNMNGTGTSSTATQPKIVPPQSTPISWYIAPTTRGNAPANMERMNVLVATALVAYRVKVSIREFSAAWKIDVKLKPVMPMPIIEGQ